MHDHRHECIGISRNWIDGKVYLADGTPLDIVGMGDVRIRVHSDSVWKLQKVRHVPQLKKNLISVGQLDEEGHAIKFHGGQWKVCMGARLLARGYKIGTLYLTTNPRDTDSRWQVHWNF